MITQNPITGRSRKKLAGVYARTLWGMNVIQSCPGPSTTQPTKALRDSRSAFGRIMRMANMIPAWLLSNIYYVAPVGRSRRHVLSSQLFAGVTRNDFDITFNLEGITKLGTNPVTSTASLLYTVPAKSFAIPLRQFTATSLADQTLLPCVFAISYDLNLCVSWLPYTSLVDDNLQFDNISDTFLDRTVLLVALWQTNVGTAQHPIMVYGSFAAN